MKQITIISGKGGTGKTSSTAAFASLAKNAVFADCDVDAADLHLIFKPNIKNTFIFKGLKLASIDYQKCKSCEKCLELCKFNAIDNEIKINKDLCEGCCVCEYICPTNAIKMVDRKSGYAYISDSRFGPLSHAMLKTAEEASGKLVTLVRENAKKIAIERGKKIIIIDGPPGIGCPVIASISGVDFVIIVTEPTLTAIHDLKRIHNVAIHFKIPSIVCINKFDINHENTIKIENYCKEKYIPIAGKIPYDNLITKAMVNEQSIIEFSNKQISECIRNMWSYIERRLV